MKLGDLVTSQKKIINPSQFQTFKYSVGLKEIEKNTGIINPIKLNNNYPKSAKYFFPKNSILFGRIRPKLKKCGVSNFEGICSLDISVLLANDEIKPDLIALILRGSKASKYIHSLQSGTSFPRIREDDLLNFDLSFISNEMFSELVEIASIISQMRKNINNIKNNCLEIESKLNIFI